MSRASDRKQWRPHLRKIAEESTRSPTTCTSQGILGIDLDDGGRDFRRGRFERQYQIKIPDDELEGEVSDALNKSLEIVLAKLPEEKRARIVA